MSKKQVVKSVKVDRKKEVLPVAIVATIMIFGFTGLSVIFIIGLLIIVACIIGIVIETRERGEK